MSRFDPRSSSSLVYSCIHITPAQVHDYRTSNKKRATHPRQTFNPAYVLVKAGCLFPGSV